MGQVADAFSEQILEKLPGHLAIGHTRYSTAGESKLDNAQPFLIDCAHGQIAVGHNGNIVNARELRDELVQRRLDLPDQQRYRSRPSPLRALEGADRRGGAGRIDRAGPGRVLARAADQEPADRVARSPRVPAARARAARRRLDRLLGNVRDGSDRRDLRSRHRARRGADHQRRRAAVDQAVPAGAARALRLRARLFRAARQLRVRPERERSAHRARAASSRARRRSTPTSSCRFPTPACARRSGLPRRRASRCGWA